MKKLLYIFSFLCFCSFVDAQSEKEKSEITKTVYQILDGFSTKDAVKINAFVNKDLGLGLEYYNEENFGYLNLEEMDFSNNFPYQKSFWEIPTPPAIQFKNIPKFKNGSMTWTDFGLFVEVGSKRIPEILNELSTSGSDLSGEEIFKVNSDPKNVAFVVFADKNSNGLQFILTKIKDKWTLTFIDLTYIKSE